MNAVPVEEGPDPPLPAQANPAGECQPAGDALFHLVMLALSVVVLALSLILRIPESRQVVLPVLGVALPEVCSLKRTTGWDCPGCGLTRSFISVAHGDWRLAWQFNPVGPYFFAIVVAQVPYRAVQVWRIRRGLREWALPRLGAGVLISLVSALLIQWVVRLLM